MTPNRHFSSSCVIAAVLALSLNVRFFCLYHQIVK